MSGEFAGVWNRQDKAVIVCEKDPQQVQSKYPNHLIVVQGPNKYDGFICVEEGALNATKCQLFIADEISEVNRKLVASWGGQCLTRGEVFGKIELPKNEENDSDPKTIVETKAYFRR